MEISSQHNRRYHAILNQAHKLDYLEFDLISHSFKLRPKSLSYDSFKQLLKALNLEYPFSEDGKTKMSTRDISGKQLTDHTTWLEATISNSGYQLIEITPVRYIIEKVKLSNCCNESIIENTDICSKCREHCQIQNKE